MNVPFSRLVPLLLLVACTSPSTQPRSAPTIDPVAPAIGATDPTGPVQVVVWSSRPLPDRVAATARKIPGVLAFGPRGSGIVDLRGARGATRSVPKRPAGAVVPITVTSISPALLRAFPEFVDEAAVLARGDALMPAASAAFRGVEPGDKIAIAGGGHTVGVRVGAVVEDGRLFRSEVIVPERAGRLLGLHTTRSLVLAVEPGRARQAERRLERAIGDFPARIRSGTVASGSLPVGRQLTLLELKQTFGEFWYRRLGGGALALDPEWVHRNIVYARVPVLGVVRCNARIVPMLRGALAEIVSSGLAGLIDSFDGCYNPRTQRTNADTISRHAYGVAFDINARTNGYGAQPKLDGRIVEVFERWGFSWGGRWRIPDGMHFEFLRYPAMLGVTG